MVIAPGARRTANPTRGTNRRPHKHIVLIHGCISDRTDIRTLVLENSDYMFEANGTIHTLTETSANAVQLNVTEGSARPMASIGTSLHRLETDEPKAAEATRS